MIIEIEINDDLLEKFKVALLLNKEDQDSTIDKLIRQYVSTTFARISLTFKRVPNSVNNEVEVQMTFDTGKANNRIPRWAMRPEQVNHKIVRAFFQIQSELGYVPLSELEKRCRDEKKFPSTFIRDFRGNFNQMKIDAPKSHGKVFEVHNGEVVVWEAIRATLEEYKEYFFNPNENR